MWVLIWGLLPRDSCPPVPLYRNMPSQPALFPTKLVPFPARLLLVRANNPWFCFVRFFFGRALLLSYLSDVSQALGQLRRPGWLVRARDSFLARLVPSKLRSRVFDALMSASLSGRLAGALSAAGRSATGVGGRWGGGARERFGGYGVPRL